MLGKRTVLVDYSEEEDTPGQSVETGKVKDRADAPPVLSRVTAEVNKPKKLISYSRLGTPNVVKSLLEGRASSGQDGALGGEGLSMGDQRKRVIQFDTVSGQKVLTLDEPREKIWKQGRSSQQVREPYYYKAMKEIYHDKIARAENSLIHEGADAQNNDDTIPVQTNPAESLVNIGGRTERVVDIKQENIVRFDYAKYMEQKERKDLLLEDKVNALRRGADTEGNQAKLVTRAMEILERDAAAEVTGIKEEGMKRNKKQYGF
jgi:hypothetical protein